MDFIYEIWSRFLAWFGNVKLLHFHMIPVLACDDNSFFVNGYDVLNIMEFISPGDVLIRGYDDYVDGKFIPDENGYSHAGLYVGNNEVIHAVSEGVSRLNVIDFCQCDRIMVLRPSSGQDEALKLAENRIGLPYDFNYESDAGKLYCFELIANCYPTSNMKTFDVSKFFGIVKRNCYLAKSIYENPFFIKLYEKNGK